jgi:hypothetical protein
MLRTAHYYKQWLVSDPFISLPMGARCMATACVECVIGRDIVTEFCCCVSASLEKGAIRNACQQVHGSFRSSPLPSNI